jgi:hypothetical protein
VLACEYARAGRRQEGGTQAVIDDERASERHRGSHAPRQPVGPALVEQVCNPDVAPSLAHEFEDQLASIAKADITLGSVL